MMLALTTLYLFAESAGPVPLKKVLKLTLTPAAVRQLADIRLTCGLLDDGRDVLRVWGLKSPGGAGFHGQLDGFLYEPDTRQILQFRTTTPRGLFAKTRIEAGGRAYVFGIATPDMWKPGKTAGWTVETVALDDLEAIMPEDRARPPRRAERRDMPCASFWIDHGDG